MEENGSRNSLTLEQVSRSERERESGKGRGKEGRGEKGKGKKRGEKRGGKNVWDLSVSLPLLSYPGGENGAPDTSKKEVWLMIFRAP